MNLKIKKFVCNPFQENTFVVSDSTSEAVIIDCGALYPEERTAILDYIAEEHLDIKHLIATHGHIDHHFGDNSIYETFGLQPEVAIADQPLMETLDKQCRMFCGQSLGYEMPPVGKYLDTADIISFGQHRFTIIPTPGHTPGSVFFYCEEENVAFSGDTLFRMSIGRTDFELGDYNAIIRSLASLKTILPPSTTIFPGHGPQTTLAEEIQCNPYLIH